MSQTQAMSCCTTSMYSQGAFLRRYWTQAPLPLALERSWECEILCQQEVEGPVLDIGCGEGLFARMLFQRPIDTGIDPDARELERAANCGAYDELIQCPGDAIPKPSATYRTIISNSVLEHIPDVRAVLVEMLRLLQPGGHAYITVPSHRYDNYTALYQVLRGLGMKSLAERYRVFFNRFWRHYHFYRPAEWKRLVEEVGFRVVDLRTYGPKPLCILNDLLVPTCIPNIALKKLTNRWTLFPRVRALVLAPLARVLESLAASGSQAVDGGLVFLALTK